MAKTPVSMTIDGYKEREVLMVTYEFSQATDVEGQMAGSAVFPRTEKSSS